MALVLSVPWQLFESRERTCRDVCSALKVAGREPLLDFQQLAYAFTADLMTHLSRAGRPTSSHGTHLLWHAHGGPALTFLLGDVSVFKVLAFALIEQRPQAGVGPFLVSEFAHLLERLPSLPVNVLLGPYAKCVAAGHCVPAFR
jgi:hypothetical protein